MGKFVYRVKKEDRTPGELYTDGRIDSAKIKNHHKVEILTKEEWETAPKSVFDCIAREVDGVFVLYGKNEDIW